MSNRYLRNLRAKQLAKKKQKGSHNKRVSDDGWKSIGIGAVIGLIAASILDITKKGSKKIYSLHQLITELGLPSEYEQQTLLYYNPHYYYVFSDGSVVMRKEDLGQYYCEREIEWFWDEFSSALRGKNSEQWVLDHIEKGASFTDEDDWKRQVARNYYGWAVEACKEYNSLEDALEDMLDETQFELTSSLDQIPDVSIDLIPFFKQFYSPTTGWFIFGTYYPAEEELLSYFNVEKKDLHLFQKIKTIVHTNPALAPYKPMLLELFKTGGGFNQVISLIESLTPLSFPQLDAIDPEDIDGLATIEVALSEINNHHGDTDDLAEWIIDQWEISGDKEFTTFLAFKSGDQDPENYIHLNEGVIHESVCNPDDADLDTWIFVVEDIDCETNEQFEKNGWFVSRP